MQQDRNQRGPDLDLQGVGRGADEGLDFEVLFDGLEEEKLDLPALLVDRGDGHRRESKTDLDPAKPRGDLLALLAGKKDDLVRDDELLDRGHAVLDDIEGHPGLGPGDEKDPLGGQALEPGEVDVAAVEDDDRPGLEAKLAATRTSATLPSVMTATDGR